MAQKIKKTLCAQKRKLTIGGKLHLLKQTKTYTFDRSILAAFVMTTRKRKSMEALYIVAYVARVAGAY